MDSVHESLWNRSHLEALSTFDDTFLYWLREWLGATRQANPWAKVDAFLSRNKLTPPTYLQPKWLTNGSNAVNKIWQNFVELKNESCEVGIYYMWPISFDLPIAVWDMGD